MATINGAIAHGITLGTSGSYASPLTITATGAVEAGFDVAIFGPAGNAWTVMNEGTITSEQVGVALSSGGSVDNAGGLINGGYLYGVWVFGAAGSVTNSGTISGSTIGIQFSAGGTVTNGSGATSALIEGTGTGVAVKGVAGTVTNFATIAGDGSAYPDAGVAMYAGGRVTNAAGGLITGNWGGVFIRGGGGTVGNTGMITAGTSGVVLFSGGTVTNHVGGLIVGSSRGVDLRNGLSGSVANYGTVQGGLSGGVYLGQYTLGSSAITNGSAASTAARITSPTGTGVEIAVVAGAVRNFGMIDGGTRGIQLDHGGTVVNGSTASTAGSIIGHNGEGIGIGGGAGTITNFGAIDGSGSGIALNSGGRVTNGASASTSASITGTSLGGIYVSSAAGTITNFGSIGGFFSGVRLAAGGVVTNQAGGSITASGQGLAVIVVGGVGTVTNFGTMSGSRAVYLGAGGTVTNGSTANTTASIGATVQLGTGGGVVTNFATISGYYGVELFNGGRVVNKSSATIRGGALNNGIGVAINGGTASSVIANFGAIVGRRGVVTSGTATGAVTLTNAGTITGLAGTAVQLGAGDDTVDVQTGAVFHGAVLGGSGNDTLAFSEAGTLALGGFAGFETIQLSSAGANTLTLTDANFADVAGAAIHVFGGAAGNTVHALNVTTANRLVFTGGVGADRVTSGAGDDLFVFSAANLSGADMVAGGGGTDQLNVTTSGTIDASGVSGVESFVLASTGANTLTLVNPNFTDVTGALIRVIGGAAGDTLKAASLTPTNTVVFKGGAGADNFIFSATSLTAADRVSGAAGTDQLMLTTSGTIATNGVTGVENFYLAGAGANTLTLTDANFSDVTGASIHVFGGAAGNTVHALKVTAANRLVFTGGAGADRVTSGAGNDLFVFSAANLTSADMIAGGDGVDQLNVTSAGTIDASGVSGIESYVLSSAGANSLVLHNGNFTDVTNATIHVFGGSAGDTVNAALLTAGNKLVFTGGAGDDIVIAGAGGATMTGGAGANRFTFTTIGTNTITDFGVSGSSDKLVFSSSGFSLGVGAGPLSPTLIGSLTNGSFSNSAQRFAFNQANGQLLYDSNGNLPGGATVIATVSGNPTVTANQFSAVA